MPELPYRDSDSTTSTDSSTLHEMNSLPRSFTGYAAVPQNDLRDEEKLQQQQQQQGHGHGHRYLTGFTSNPLPSEASFQSHTHCEACDAFLERQHKRRFAILLAWIGAIMFVASLIFGLVLGIVIVNAKKDSPYYH